MSDGINDGLGGHRDWQTLWNDWNEERQKSEMLYRDLQKLREELQASEANAANLCLEWNAAIEKAEARAESAVREAERLRHGAAVEGDFVCPDSVRALELETVLREVIPQSMGGYPDLFYPPGGWEAWEERALAILERK